MIYQNSRNPTWDYARGIAIVMIVIHHLYPRFHVDSLGHPDSLVPTICYTCQLPVFMYISGLFSRQSILRNGLTALISNRAIRLLLPFFSFLLIWSIIKPDNAILVFTEDFKDGYWFTFVLFEMMTIIALAKYISNKTKLKTIYTLTAFYIILTIYQAIIPRSNLFNNLFSINLLWHYFPFFVIGYYSNRLEWIFQKKFTYVFALTYAISFYFFFKYDIRALTPICNLSSLLLLVTLFTHGVTPFKNIFAIIGTYSLQIYLLHFFAKLFIKYINPIDNPYIEFVQNVILTALIVIICILISKLIMKSYTLGLFLFGITKKKIKQ